MLMGAAGAIAGVFLTVEDENNEANSTSGPLLFFGKVKLETRISMVLNLTLTRAAKTMYQSSLFFLKEKR